MAKYVVIVESPAKVKTIKKFLGPNYEVVASNGHVRDLPKSQMGIDIENGFEPKYITIRGKGELLAKLRRVVKKADKVYLATDPDREGEAISWHLLKSLKLEDKKVYRIAFNEITKNAVKESLKDARELKMDLVDAQQARRCLDRMVGYRISPLLWKKVKRGLSAGRVQSVALRIICDREEEINAFIPEEYWTLDGSFFMDKSKKALVASYYGTGSKKAIIKSQEEVDAIINDLKGASYHVDEIKKGERSKKAPLPFTTSTLQQEASKSLNFSTQKTMRLAQQLYEGIELKGKGTVALITYLRTDSTRVSETAQEMAKEYITKNYGEEYNATEEKKNNNQAKIQDAHEAIRPVDIEVLPIAIKDLMSRDLFRLYQLIWKRFTASRMQAAKYETTNLKIKAKDHKFSVSASRIIFDGFTSVYQQAEEKEEVKVLDGSITQDSTVEFCEFESVQHFTQPPAHYTEASLVHELETLGIGRPSTYAPTITTILARRYVTKENKNLYLTEIGEVVNGIMKEAFPSIVDVNFTVNLEALLDSVEEGKVGWKKLLENFYPDLDQAVLKAEEELAKIEIADEVSEEPCVNCGQLMVVKYGPHGKFLACPGFPECRSTKAYFEKIDVECPKCKKDIVLKKTKKGRKYYGCIDNPECDFMEWQKPSKIKCKECGSLMVEKGNKLVCRGENCGFIQIID